MGRTTYVDCITEVSQREVICRQLGDNRPTELMWIVVSDAIFEVMFMSFARHEDAAAPFMPLANRVSVPPCRVPVKAIDPPSLLHA